MADLNDDLAVSVGLGAPVRFTRTLTRRSRYDSSRRVTLKVWEAEGYPGQPTPAAQDGVLIGVRSLSNGENHYFGRDEPIEYRATEVFKAYLVAYDLRRKPVLVLPEHLAVL